MICGKVLGIPVGSDDGVAPTGSVGEVAYIKDSWSHVVPDAVPVGTAEFVGRFVGAAVTVGSSVPLALVDPGSWVGAVFVGGDAVGGDAVGGDTVGVGSTVFWSPVPVEPVAVGGVAVEGDTVGVGSTVFWSPVPVGPVLVGGVTVGVGSVTVGVGSVVVP